MVDVPVYIVVKGPVELFAPLIVHEDGRLLLAGALALLAIPNAPNIKS